MLRAARSAELTRRAPYSTDLRWRVIWQRLALGFTFQKITQNLSIAIGTVHDIFQLFEATGEVDPKTPCKRERKLNKHHEIYIIGLILDCSTLHLLR